jgi:hypothetical protein
VIILGYSAIVIAIEAIEVLKQLNCVCTISVWVGDLPFSQEFLGLQPGGRRFDTR